MLEMDVWMVSIEGIGEVLGANEMTKGEILDGKMC